MKVLHVCYADAGGGGFIGANRLHTCMAGQGLDSSLLVIRKRTDSPGVIEVPRSLQVRNTMARRLSGLILRLQRTTDASYRSLNIFPTGVPRIINRAAADIVQLHWVGDNTIGLSEFAKIEAPVVWKLPDLWAFSGAEHYPSNMERGVTGYLRENRPAGTRGPDIDRAVWALKMRYWQYVPMTIVCPSRWLASRARASMLFSQRRIECIPNPVDTEVFSPHNGREQTRAGLGFGPRDHLFLFSSLSRLSDARKGFGDVRELLKRLAAVPRAGRMGLLVLGGRGAACEIPGVHVRSMGYVADAARLAEFYSAVDITLLPSRADNLPNVVKESMACGTPCIAYDAGGARDMIDHRVNGCLVESGDIRGLEREAEWLLAQNAGSLRSGVREKAKRQHAPERAVARYVGVYKELLTGQGLHAPSNEMRD